MDAPTAASVRAWEPAYAFAGYPAPSQGQADPLERLVAVAVASVQAITGRPLDASMPTALEPIAQQAVLLFVKQLARGAGTAGVQAQAGAGIKRFSAGDYSQDNFGPEDLAKGRLLNPWPALSDLLWLLCTPERRAEHDQQMSGVTPPIAGSLGGSTLGDPYAGV